MVLKILDLHTYTKHEFRHRPYIFTKINSKWIIHLVITGKSIKFLETNIKENLDSLQYDGDF
jgi:hypothetical protein